MPSKRKSSNGFRYGGKVEMAKTGVGHNIFISEGIDEQACRTSAMRNWRNRKTRTMLHFHSFLEPCKTADKTKDDPRHELVPAED